MHEGIAKEQRLVERLRHVFEYPEGELDAVRQDLFARAREERSKLELDAGRRRSEQLGQEAQHKQVGAGENKRARSLRVERGTFFKNLGQSAHGARDGIRHRESALGQDQHATIVRHADIGGIDGIDASCCRKPTVGHRLTACNQAPPGTGATVLRNHGQRWACVASPAELRPSPSPLLLSTCRRIVAMRRAVRRLAWTGSASAPGEPEKEANHGCQ